MIHWNPTGVSVALLALSLQAGATGDPRTAGAAANAMGGTGITRIDLFSALNNQAALGFLESIQFGVFAEQRFVGVGIGNYAGAVALPTGSGTFAASINSFGYAMYRDTRIGLGYGRKLSDHFSIGIQVDYVGTSIPEYGSASTVVVEAGLMAKPSPKWQIAAHAYNFTQSTIGELEERLASVMSLGVRYSSSERLALAVEIGKDIQYGPDVHAGIEYTLADALVARAGFATNPAAVAIGLGFNLSKLHVDVGSSYNRYLGLSPHTSLVHEGGK
jgi:hypothetical protein